MRQNIDINDFAVKPSPLWGKRWFVLGSGDFASDDYNGMTVAWGSFGVMWHKPFVQIVVRPGRYSYGLLEKYPDFTLSLLPESSRDAMSLMGSKTGRDMDKFAAASLTAIPSETVGAPGVDEAELIIECKTMYRQEMDPSGFIDESIHSSYPKKDFHIIYFGEIMKISGTEEFAG